MSNGERGGAIETVKSLPAQSASQVVLSRIQFTIHATRRTPHGASRLVQAMSALSVKTRRAPSRHCRDARVDGHTTTDVHDIEYNPPPRLSSSLRIPLSSSEMEGCGGCVCLVWSSTMKRVTPVCSRFLLTV